jgi:hypothetical protein
MFTPGIAIFYLATILRPNHVRGVRAGFSNILSDRWQHAGARALERRHSSPSTLSRRRDNMDRASQVLVQGVPPSVPRSYRALADHGNVAQFYTPSSCSQTTSIKDKARGQQYLKLYEEDVVVEYLLQMSCSVVQHLNLEA